MWCGRYSKVKRIRLECWPCGTQEREEGGAVIHTQMEGRGISSTLKREKGDFIDSQTREGGFHLLSNERRGISSTLKREKGDFIDSQMREGGFHPHSNVGKGNFIHTEMREGGSLCISELIDPWVICKWLRCLTTVWYYSRRWDLYGGKINFHLNIVS